ncbi:hypothetical protein [Staphylococcus aureus]
MDKIKDFEETGKRLIKIMRFGGEVEGGKEVVERYKDEIIF